MCAYTIDKPNWPIAVARTHIQTQTGKNNVRPKVDHKAGQLSLPNMTNRGPN